MVGRHLFLSNCIFVIIFMIVQSCAIFCPSAESLLFYFVSRLFWISVDIGGPVLTQFHQILLKLTYRVFSNKIIFFPIMMEFFQL